MGGKAVFRIGRKKTGVLDSKDLGEGFQAAALKEVALPFPSRELSNLLLELPTPKKKLLCSSINLQIRSQPNKPFPDEQLVKLARIKTKSKLEKEMFISGLINVIMDIYGDVENLSAEDFLTVEEEKSKEFGPWHYYWGLRLFPIESEAIEKRRTELETQLPDNQPHTINVAKIIPINPDREMRESKENSIISKERQLRQKSEQEAARLKSQVRTFEKANERLKQERDSLQSEKTLVVEQLRVTEETLRLEIKKTQTLDREKLELKNQIKQLKKAVQHLTENEIGLKKKYEEELASLREELTVPELQLTEMADRIITALNEKSDNYYTQLRSGQASRQEQGVIRKQISDCFTLIEALETHFSIAPEQVINTAPATPAPAMADPVYSTVNVEPEFEQLLKEHLPLIDNDNSNHPQLGTFYRKDHGGYIVLENNEIFNITESMVNGIGLEHEAEVECERVRREDGSMQDNIRLLLQGDDAYAPMTQYMGYIELGENFTFYCVDMNNPNNRFPIYDKDVEIQQPRDGDPCLFNVANDGEHARISKVYYRSSYGKTPRDLIVKEKSVCATTKRKSERTKQVAFLEGCKIVIVGGLEKWFESVVRETGAELYHENGASPDRIHAKLRRADALFMLLTATSHEAIWSCVDIAKENNIPHFRIEGSKSNLRKLLWENRDRIRKDLVTKC